MSIYLCASYMCAQGVSTRRQKNDRSMHCSPPCEYCSLQWL